MTRHTSLDGFGRSAAPMVRCHQCPLRARRAFRDKPAEEIAFIDGLKSAHRKLPAGTEIIHAGQEKADLFTLFDGWALRHRTLPDGRRQILNILLPGDLIGLQASMLAAADHAVEALTDVELCVVPRAKVWSIFREGPELAYDLTWLGAREERMVDVALTSVGQHSALERMASLLLGLYRRLEHLDMVRDRSFAFPLGHQHLADALGLSLVHTTKTWARLRRMGLFQMSGGRMTVLNPRLTASLAQSYDREWQPRPLL
jgi:CRP-like cAMP-binding protein